MKKIKINHETNIVCIETAENRIEVLGLDEWLNGIDEDLDREEEKQLKYDHAKWWDNVKTNFDL